VNPVQLFDLCPLHCADHLMTKLTNITSFIFHIPTKVGSIVLLNMVSKFLQYL